MVVDIHREPSQASTKSEFMGFANFPNQVFRRCIKNGFHFTLMTVGQSGLGKSTFINSLFLAEVYDAKPHQMPIPSTVKIESKTVCLVENDVKLYMTFVDTPGFGDAVDNSNCWEPIINFVDQRFADYLAEETKIERPENIADNRVHLCFYFIAPTGHGLKELDIEFMKALQDQGTLVGLKNAPTKCEDNRKRIPFAVVGSNKVVDIGTKRTRIREYPWGTVEVENLAHNDFLALRDMVIRSNLVDLINVTRDIHYENFRYKQMCKGAKGNLERDPFTQLEEERRTVEKEAAEVRRTKEKIFAEKVADREHKLAERGRALDEQEKENRRILNEKHGMLQKSLEELSEMRRAAGLNDSGSSIGHMGRNSPPDGKKKKSSTLNIFNRN
uniref:Septin n=1 Tax=Panagrolaimus sp. ES5 TaxID=591445 RepID=A0AC34FH36_9BILA